MRKIGLLILCLIVFCSQPGLAKPRFEFRYHPFHKFEKGESVVVDLKYFFDENESEAGFAYMREKGLGNPKAFQGKIVCLVPVVAHGVRIGDLYEVKVTLVDSDGTKHRFKQELTPGKIGKIIDSSGKYE